MKIRTVRAEFFHADRRTDMKLLIVFFFRKFANSPEQQKEKGHGTGKLSENTQAREEIT